MSDIISSLVGQPIGSLPCLIDMGGSYSHVVALAGYYVVGLITPSEWDAAPVTVQVSVEGDNYYDLFNGVGGEFTFNVTPDIMINVDPNLLMMANFLRLRSGTRGLEVPQTKERRFYVVVKGTIAVSN
jgi:hypothetical protein